MSTLHFSTFEGLDAHLSDALYKSLTYLFIYLYGTSKNFQNSLVEFRPETSRNFNSWGPLRVSPVDVVVTSGSYRSGLVWRWWDVYLTWICYCRVIACR